MDEEEWNTSLDFDAMLNFARQKLTRKRGRLFHENEIMVTPYDHLMSDRKLRLLAAELWRHTPSFQFASEGDGSVTIPRQAEDMADSFRGVMPPYSWEQRQQSMPLQFNLSAEKVRGIAYRLGQGISPVPGNDGRPDILREICNPFNKLLMVSRKGYVERFTVGLGSSMKIDECVIKNPDVQRMAAEMYDNREFHLHGHLADALDDANCPPCALIDHLRSSGGPHLLGCWALDLILGKE